MNSYHGGRDHIRKNYSTEPAPALEAPARVQNVEDFVPEDGLDRSFLEDTTLPKDKKKIGAKGPQQDSDRYGWIDRAEHRVYLKGQPTQLPHPIHTWVSKALLEIVDTAFLCACWVGS